MSTWLALVLTDVIAVATFARCFTGPGELTASLATLLVVQLAGFAGDVVHGNRTHRVPACRTASGRADGAGADPQATLRATGRLVGARRCRGSAHAGRDRARVPFFSWCPTTPPGTPCPRTSGLRGGRSRSRWLRCPSCPGSSWRPAWAAGAAGLLAELISSSAEGPRRLRTRARPRPVPLRLRARHEQLASDRARRHGGLGCWYLVAVVRERDACSGRPGCFAGHRPQRRGTRRVLRRGRRWSCAWPCSPPSRLRSSDRTCPALAAWRSSPGTAGRRRERHRLTVVQAASSAAGRSRSARSCRSPRKRWTIRTSHLFTVYSSTPTRELIATLDNFNGEQLERRPCGASQAVPSFSCRRRSRG